MICRESGAGFLDKSQSEVSENQCSLGLPSMSLSESRGVQMSLSESRESTVLSRSGNSFATTAMMLPVIMY